MGARLGQLTLQQPVLHRVGIERDAGQQANRCHQPDQQAEHQQAMAPQSPC